MKLKDRVAIVTGGASGIGAASARLFAAEGAKLALVDQDEIGLGQVAADIEAAGGSAIIIPADVSSDAEARAGVDRVIEKWGRIDVLLTAAGMSTGGTVDAIEEAAFRGGMRTLWNDGLEKVLVGLTSVEELARVVV